MPTISRDLDGLGLYALAFAAPLASGVVGMVAAGQWSDRWGRHPVAGLPRAVLDRHPHLRPGAVDGGARGRPGRAGARDRRPDRQPVRRGRGGLPGRTPAFDLRQLCGRMGAAVALRTGARGPGGRRVRLALGLPRRGRPRRAGRDAARAGRACPPAGVARGPRGRPAFTPGLGAGRGGDGARRRAAGLERLALAAAPAIVLVLVACAPDSARHVLPAAACPR